MVLGDPPTTATTMGPVVSAEQLDRVRGFVEGAPADGAELVFGGRVGGDALFPRDPRSRVGYWVEPTLFRVPGNDLRDLPRGGVRAGRGGDAVLVRRRGPARSRTTPRYGLAAGVWTNDLRRAHRMVRDLDAGSVWVNAYRRIHWALPFGGFGDSGYGKDSGWESVLENTRIKTSWMELG